MKGKVISMGELIHYDEYLSKPQSVDKLASNLARQGLLKKIEKDHRIVDYALTPKGEETGEKIIDYALSEKWLEMPPFIFRMRALPVMPKPYFIEAARTQLSLTFCLQRALVERPEESLVDTVAREIIGYHYRRIPDMIQSIALFSSYACLEKFKREKPNLLEEEEQRGMKVLVYKGEIKPLGLY